MLIPIKMGSFLFKRNNGTIQSNKGILKLLDTKNIFMPIFSMSMKRRLRRNRNDC